MECVDLAILRQNATRVRNEMLAQKSKKRSFALTNDRYAGREGGDLEVFLQRRLQKMAMLIDNHIAQHCCQD